VKRPKAYAVLEEYENTGGIVFAHHAVTARRMGANEYADGEFGAVSCRRAPWADKYAESGCVPASDMIHQGWHFECCGCGVRIDYDLGNDDDRYAEWTPDDVIGYQHSEVFCMQSCEDAHMAEQAERKRVCERAIDRFRNAILHRFPDAAFISDDRYRGMPHAWASRRHPDRHWRIEQCVVPFTLPDFEAKYGPISLDYHSSSSWPKDRKPHYTCAGGDKDAFEAYVKAAALKAREASGG